MNKIIKYFIFVIFISIIIIITIFLELNGIVYHNDFFALKYEVKGIDVSHHQYRINWNEVNKEKYSFVIMKATEGKNFLDRDFFYNWNKTQLNGFVVGAYHFFVMTSTGIEQANFYISKVPKMDDSLPPVIDFEISTKYDKEKVIYELKNMIDKLEKHYKKRVIIYVNYKTYEKYIKNEFKNNKLWVRDVKFYPRIEEDDRWVLWQYNSRGRISGNNGFTDKNAFRYKDIKKFIEEMKIKE